jgi:hypothetical protein
MSFSCFLSPQSAEPEMASTPSDYALTTLQFSGFWRQIGQFRAHFGQFRTISSKFQCLGLPIGFLLNRSRREICNLGGQKPGLECKTKEHT